MEKEINILSAIMGLLFLIFRFIDIYQIDIEKIETQKRYKNIWQKINDTNYKEVPSFLLDLFLEIKNTKSNVINIVKKSKVFSNQVAFIFASFVFIIYQVCKYIDFSQLLTPNVYYYLIYNISLIALIYFYFFLIRDNKHRIDLDEKSKKKLSKRLESNLNFYFFFFMFSALLTINILFYQNIFKDLINSNQRIKIVLVVMVNIIFDFFTIAYSVRFLELLRKFESIMIQIFSILLIIFISFFFSYMTLIMLNIILELNLNQLQIMKILTASIIPEGKIEFGKWFIISHTTFLPILMFGFVVLISFLAKAIIIPLNQVIGRASIIEKPHYLTANLFIVLAGVLQLIKVILME